MTNFVCIHSGTIIKPCPFCGGKPINSYNGSLRYIMCTKCFSKGSPICVRDKNIRDNIQANLLAVLKWNNRSNE